MSPVAWEIQKAQDDRVLLGIIMPPDLAVSIGFAQALKNIQLPPGSNTFKSSGLPFGPARNQVAKAALEGGYNLAFLDADVRVEPDAYMKLLSTGLEFVSGLYYQRYPPFMPCAFNIGHDDKGNIQRAPIQGWKPGDIFPADFIPGGLCLIRHGLLRRVFEVFPLPYYWGVDIAPVPDYGNKNADAYSEDFTFSYRVKTALGVQGYIASGVIGLHEAKAIVGPRWMLPMPSPDPTHGVVAVQ